MKDRTRKDIAIDIIVQGVGSQDKSIINELVKEDYIQHNPTVPDGRKGLLMMVEKIINGEIPTPTINMKRALEDGDYVVLHSDFDWGGKKAVFELFRFEGSLAAEHWSGIQDQPQQTANGHTMMDGLTEIKDRDKTETNKALIKEFLEMIFLQGQFDKIAHFFQGDNYIQHNPMIADGLSGLFKGLEEMQKNGVKIEFHKVHQILGEGNFVLALSEGNFNGKPTAFYDLFRIENGKIAEHWDVLQEVPATMPHNNGMF
jgi:predicted SnoaL-like aldol condensation-catalyzing enzyme